MFESLFRRDRPSSANPHALQVVGGPEGNPTRNTAGSGVTSATPESAAPVLGAGMRLAGAKVEGRGSRDEGLTLAALVRAWRSADRKATRAAIDLGKLADTWIRRQLADRSQPDRGMAVKAIRTALAADGFGGEALRVNRYVGIYHLATLLGIAEAEQVQVTALRALLPLVRRNKYDAWSLRADHADAAMALWSQIILERLSAAAVQDAVRRIRPARKAKKAARKRPNVARIIRTLDRLSVEQLQELHAACAERLDSAQAASQNAAA